MDNKFTEILFFKNLKGIGNVQINKKYLSVIQHQLNGIDECIDYAKKNIGKLMDADIVKAKEKTEALISMLEDDKSIKVLTVFSQEYPSKLDVMGDKKPVILYAKGNTELLNKKCIAVVGTREPEDWTRKAGEVLVKRVIDEVGKEKIVVVSGLALGCDRIAHENTLINHGYTVAVLPSGVNVITPASHKTLAKQIINEKGCLISEYEPNAKVTRSTYVERDKIVAAFCDLTMVLQCKEKSGTMHTVKAAVEYGRKTACLGASNLKNIMFEGNKYMIENYGSVKIMNSEDMVKLVQSLGNPDGFKNDREFKQMFFD